MIRCLKHDDCKNWEFEWNEFPCNVCVWRRNDPREEKDYYEPVEKDRLRPESPEGPKLPSKASGYIGKPEILISLLAGKFDDLIEFLASEPWRKE